MVLFRENKWHYIYVGEVMIIEPCGNSCSRKMGTEVWN
jgi:hypothetical protein